MAEQVHTKPLIRVVKLGGSLLDMPNLKKTFYDWLNRQPTASNILIVGGGPLVDKIRKQNEASPLEPVQAHWLCIDAMSRNCEKVAAEFQFGPVLAKGAVTKKYAELTTLLSDGNTVNTVFDPQEFLANDEPHITGTPLEAGWHVTSDSIAARVAEVLGATQLVLLKSSLPAESNANLVELSGNSVDEFYVDDFFPAAAAKIPLIRFVNLRSTDRAELMLSTPSRVSNHA